jgi:hypothetical protein
MQAAGAAQLKMLLARVVAPGVWKKTAPAPPPPAVLPANVHDAMVVFPTEPA